MTRYYFDIRDGGGLCSDEEGTELASQRAALIEATNALADMARDMANLNQPPQDVAIEVRTESRRVFQAALIFQMR